MRERIHQFRASSAIDQRTPSRPPDPLRPGPPAPYPSGSGGDDDERHSAPEPPPRADRSRARRFAFVFQRGLIQGGRPATTSSPSPSSLSTSRVRRRPPPVAVDGGGDDMAEIHPGPSLPTIRLDPGTACQAERQVR
jgi:hypothetical protein